MDPTSSSKPDIPFPAPPTPYVLPGWVSVSMGVLLVGLILFLATRYDPTKGPMTISILVVIGFFMAMTWAIRFNIPQDPETAALIGALVSAFGGVVAYWIGGGNRPPN